MDDGSWAGGLVQHPVAHQPEQQSRHRPPPAGADDQQPGLAGCLGQSQHGMADLAQRQVAPSPSIGGMTESGPTLLGPVETYDG
jgi:hypothetical protein